MIYSGFSKSKALLVNFATAATAVLGAVLGIILGETSEAFLGLSIPFAAGGFIYIAGATLIPELHQECGWKQSLFHFSALLVGIGLMAALLFLES